MRKVLIWAAAAGAIVLSSVSAFAADAVRLQLKWVTQAQFAGYYVALDKGYYEEADLDVTILPGGPDIAPEQVIAAGGADVITTWMAAALAARERGVPLVNIAQPFSGSALQVVCRKDTGIASTGDFKGKTLGVWFYGNEYPFFAWMAKLGYATQGGADGITVIRQAFNADPLIQRQADCISTMRYNEYRQVLQAGIPESDLLVFNYRDEGVGMLEDGLYVLEQNLADPAFADKMARFVAASMKGWAYAQEHPDEAAQIVVDNDQTGATTLDHQVYMMGEIAKILGNGVLDEAAYAQTVATLLSATGADDPAITKEPTGAWTHSVTAAAGLN